MSKNLWRCRCGRRVEILTDDNFGDCGCSDPVYGPEYFYMTTECADMLDEMDKDYSDQAKQLAEARAEIEQLKQLWSCNLDIIGGELNKQLAEARAIVAQQKKTFVAALQNATAISASQLRIAEQLKSESSPEMLESERAANATLTEELEKALAEIEALKCCGNCKDCFSNKNKTICKTCNRNPYGTKQTDNWSHSETKRKGT